jgi:hypothetical protein
VAKLLSFGKIFGNNIEKINPIVIKIKGAVSLLSRCMISV